MLEGWDTQTSCHAADMARGEGVSENYTDVDELIGAIETALKHSESVVFATVNDAERNQIRRAVRQLGQHISARPIKGGRMEVTRHTPSPPEPGMDPAMAWALGYGDIGPYA